MPCYSQARYLANAHSSLGRLSSLWWIQDIENYKATQRSYSWYFNYICLVPESTLRSKSFIEYQSLSESKALRIQLDLTLLNILFFEVRGSNTGPSVFILGKCPNTGKYQQSGHVLNLVEEVTLMWI